MKRIVFLALAFMIGVGLTAQTAVFQKVVGKVEYQLKGKDWQPAKEKLSVPAGTMISTGFRSEATLNINGSLINVRPLTRLSLDELISKSGSGKSEVFLVAGKVRAEVKPGASKANDSVLTVKSPTATASVRGTGFEFDGTNLLVRHGAVELRNGFNGTRSIEGGELSSVLNNGLLLQPISVTKVETSPLLENPPESFDFGDGTYGDYSIDDAYFAYGDTLLDDSYFSVQEEISSIVSDFFGTDFYIPGYLESTEVILAVH